MLFRLEVVGLENLPPARRAQRDRAQPCLVPRRADRSCRCSTNRRSSPIDLGIANRWWIKPFLKLADARALDPARPLATRALIQEVRKGRRLVIFPEGRITVTGSLMKIYDGAAMIAEKADALVTPVRLDGPERTPFSRLSPAQIGRRWFPKIVVTICPPRRIRVDPELRARARRRAAGAALYDIMSDLIFADHRITTARCTRPSSGVSRRAACRAGRTIVQDPIVGRDQRDALPHRRRPAGAQDSRT